MRVKVGNPEVSLFEMVSADERTRHSRCPWAEACRTEPAVDYMNIVLIFVSFIRPTQWSLPIIFFNLEPIRFRPVLRAGFKFFRLKGLPLSPAEVRAPLPLANPRSLRHCARAPFAEESELSSRHSRKASPSPVTAPNACGGRLRKRGQARVLDGGNSPEFTSPR